jgi:hypothetical protein
VIKVDFESLRLGHKMKLNWLVFFKRLFAIYSLVVSFITVANIIAVRAPEVATAFDIPLDDGSTVRVAGADRAHAERLYNCWQQERCYSYPTQEVTWLSSATYWFKEAGLILFQGILWLVVPVALSRTFQWLWAGLKAPLE